MTGGDKLITVTMNSILWQKSGTYYPLRSIIFLCLFLFFFLSVYFRKKLRRFKETQLLNLRIFVDLLLYPRRCGTIVLNLIAVDLDLISPFIKLICMVEIWISNVEFIVCEIMKLFINGTWYIYMALSLHSYWQYHLSCVFFNAYLLVYNLNGIIGFVV